MCGLLFACFLCFWISFSHKKNDSSVSNQKPDNPNATGNPKKLDIDQLKFKFKSNPQNPNFPINDQFELPFLGKVSCHARQEKVQFTVTGITKEWAFKVYYLRNGIFARAEFLKPGAKDYEFPVDHMQAYYDSRGQYILGFPEKAASASLAKVLESLYNFEAFDSATKINISYVLLDETELRGKVQPCFIANIWGVSTGIMTGRVPEDDERFLKYRVFLDQNGEVTATDNGL